MITEAENAAKLQMIQGKYAGAALDADSFQNLQAELANYTEQAIQSTDEAYQKVLTSLNAQRLAGEKGMEAEFLRRNLTPVRRKRRRATIRVRLRRS